MLSQKLQKDLMNAYAAVHEEKRGHAAGDSDVEKQASQLASDVRYKAKGKIKPGASDEEKKKVMIQILGASPAPNAVKAMAKSKLLGEAKVDSTKIFNVGGDRNVRRFGKEGQFDPQGSGPRGQDISQKAKLAAQRTKEHEARRGQKTGAGGYTPSGKVDEGKVEDYRKAGNLSREAISVGSNTKKGQDIMKKVNKMTKKMNKEEVEVKEGSAYGIYKGDGKMKIGKAPRTQKGAMAYDGPNKERSEAADRVIAKTKAKRKKMKMEGVELVHGNYGNYVNGQKTEKREERPMTPEQRRLIPEKKAAKDYDGDGKVESGTQEFLGSRDKAIKKAIAKRRGRVKEGFSAWRIDLDFQESVKK